MLMVEKSISKNSFKENTVALAKLSLPIALVVAVGVPAAVGWISNVAATYEAEDMLRQLGLSRRITLDNGFNISRDGAEISFDLEIFQKDEPSHHLTIIFPKDKASETPVANSKVKPAVKLAADNIVKIKPLSLSPLSLPRSEVMDLRTSDKIRLEGNVEVSYR